MDVAVIRVVVGCSVEASMVQRVLRLDHGQRVVRGHAARVVAHLGEHGGNRAGLRRINRDGVQREQGFACGDTVARLRVKREERTGERRGDLFGVRGDDLCVGRRGQRAGGSRA